MQVQEARQTVDVVAADDHSPKEQIDASYRTVATPDTAACGATSAVLEAVLNLSRFHRDHEKFYGQEPRAQGVTLQRHARALQALADRWSTTQPEAQHWINPFEGSQDLNDPTALQLDGVLFMEGAGEPTEIARLKRDLRTLAADNEATGRWLADAMQATWEASKSLLSFPTLADQLGERHRIISNDWECATLSLLAARHLLRAVDILERIDFTPKALRADLDGGRRVPDYLYSAAELIDRGADLLSVSAGLVQDNERRWRVFRKRVQAVVNEEG
jgi:hypothetical protein